MLCCMHVRIIPEPAQKYNNETFAFYRIQLQKSVQEENNKREKNTHKTK